MHATFAPPLAGHRRSPRTAVPPFPSDRCDASRTSVAGNAPLAPVIRRLIVNFGTRAVKARRVIENGRAWLVAPMVMIDTNHGVLAGSKGPLRYTPEDTCQVAAAWNGVPITHFHPFDPVTNEHLSASDPGVWERQGIGEVRGARCDTSNRLVAEGWHDEELTKNKAPEVHSALLSGQPMELSTGLFTTNEPAPAGAAHNGKPYEFFARNHRPDHLAVLHPSQVGACSVNDGCGVNVNRLTQNALDKLGGEKPAVDPEQLKAADFVTFDDEVNGDGVSGARCTKCVHNEDGVCQFEGEINGKHVNIKGQPVNERNCCSGWNVPGTLRAWKPEGSRIANSGDDCKT